MGRKNEARRCAPTMPVSILEEMLSDAESHLLDHDLKDPERRWSCTRKVLSQRIEALTMAIAACQRVVELEAALRKVSKE